MRAVFALVLVVGMALAGVAVYMIQGYMADLEGALRNEQAFNAKAGKLVEVFVFAKPKKYGDPLAEDDVVAIYWPEKSLPQTIFRDKAAYLADYARDWKPWLDRMKAAWASPGGDLTDVLRLWWEPLLAMAPNLREGIGAACLIRSGDRTILVDFPGGTVLDGAGEHAFRFDIEPALLDAVVAERAVDWSNSLFLSCRFTAWRDGDFNEYLYNFFKSLSVERMMRAEAEAKQKLHGTAADDRDGDVRIGDYVVQRRCPHRNADLSVFGEIEDGNLVCTLHGWRFDLETGQCLTAKEKTIRIKKRS
jgi:UDP-MurNAc hydroxylase